MQDKCCGLTTKKIEYKGKTWWVCKNPLCPFKIFVDEFDLIDFDDIEETVIKLKEVKDE